MMLFKLILPLIFISTIYASTQDNILSKQRVDLLDLTKQQVEQNANKLSKDWINPIVYKYIRTYGIQSSIGSKEYSTAKSMVTINQPIFKSGGIYQAIKYSDALEKYQYTDIEVSKKLLIQQAVSFLFQIHKMKYTIEKQKLLIKNSQIDIERKKEQVFNGLIDTSFLDNAILDGNIKKNALMDLEFQLKSLIYSFDNLSSKPYNEFELPRFDIVSKEQFIKDNIYLKKSQLDINSKKWLSSMTISKYLPTVNFTYDYSKYHKTDGITTNENSSSYGFNISIPLDVRTFNDIQSSKLEHLKALKSYQIEQKEQENFLKTKLDKLELLDKKVKIAQDDLKLYNSLLTQMKELEEAGIKTKSDVDTMQNSLDIKYLDIKILDIEAQLELLELYSRLK
jgi:outer membrane protein TolC